MLNLKIVKMTCYMKIFFSNLTFFLPHFFLNLKWQLNKSQHLWDSEISSWSRCVYWPLNTKVVTLMLINLTVNYIIVYNNCTELYNSIYFTGQKCIRTACPSYLTEQYEKENSAEFRNTAVLHQKFLLDGIIGKRREKRGRADEPYVFVCNKI